MQQPIWVDVMVEEYDSIVRNSVWDVVPRLENKSVVSSCWLNNVKQAVDGSVEKHKARFVAHVFSQVDGELFVSQCKYANEILRRFHMEKCKPMQTPLAGNRRKEDATSGEVVDATVYRQLVGSLMYLVNT